MVKFGLVKFGLERQFGRTDKINVFWFAFLEFCLVCLIEFDLVCFAYAYNYFILFVSLSVAFVDKSCCAIKKPEKTLPFFAEKSTSSHMPKVFHLR